MSEKSPNDHVSNHKKFIPFFPDYILDEVIAWYIALALLIVLASLFPSGLEEQADPLSTPSHIKPEWYFLSLYQALKWVPRLVGALSIPVGVLLLFLLPFIDRSSSRAPRNRIVPIGIGLVVVIAVIVLTIWGWLS